MNKPHQLLLVVETSSEEKTDAIYINEVIKKYFDVSGVNIKFVPLGGKKHYKDKKIIGKINNYTKMFHKFTNGETITIYFIDTDSVNREYKTGSFFKNLCIFVKQSGYELVWFCKNAENVFLNLEPETLDNKTQMAKAFAAENKINNICKENLSKSIIELNCSNILTVLTKYLNRKD